MKTFRFTFSGKIKPHLEKSAVQLNIAKLFHVDESEVAPLFNDECRFERGQLDEYTARSYEALFLRAGAIGEISADTPSFTPPKNAIDTRPQTTTAKIPEKTKESTHCPKCQSTQTNEHQCLECGIYFAKYLAAQALHRPLHHHPTAAETPTPVSPHPQPRDDSTPRNSYEAHNKARELIAQASASTMNHHDTLDPIEQLLLAEKAPAKDLSQKANRWLKWSSIAIVATVIADRYLQGGSLTGQVGIGSFPLLFAHLGLLRGCFLLARVKGLEVYMGLLGLFSLAGLSILLLLPNHNGRENPITNKKIAFAAVCCGLFIYWLGGSLITGNNTRSFFEAAEQLANGRIEYPIRERQASHNVYLSEQQEMQDFLATTLHRLATTNYRPDDISNISQRMFAELSRYEIWRNYQRYLHITEKQTLPRALDKEFTRSDRRFFSEYLQEHITHSSHARLSAAHSDWMLATTPEKTPDGLVRFDIFVNSIYENFRSAYLQKIATQDQDAPPISELHTEDIVIPTYKNTNTRVFDTYVEYTAGHGMLKKTPFALGFYLEPYLNKRKQRHYHPKMIIISPEFPAKYISGPAAVFDGYKEHTRN